MFPTASQAAPPNWTQRLRSLPWTTRLAGFLAVALLLVAALMSNRPRAGTGLVSLLGDSRLQALDLQRMRLALARAGIADAEVREQQLWVPREYVAAALKTIHEQDLLPGNLRAFTLNAPQISPFVTRYQQQLQQEHQKKLAIQALLRRLEFVADAALEIDFPDARTTPGAGRPRCTVTIQPQDNSYLEPAQLETIRQIALGSLSQLHREDLVIVDLAAGMAFDDQLMARPQTAEQLKMVAQLRSRQRLGRELHRALADMGDMEILVSFRERDPEKPMFAPGSIAGTAAERPRGMLPSARRSLPGTNGIASVSAVPPPPGSSPPGLLTGDPPALEASVDEQSTLRPEVTIRLARVTAVENLKSGDTLAGTMEQDRLRQEIVRRVRPLLPQTAFGVPESEVITIEFVSPAVSGPAITGLGLSWNAILGSRGGGIWIAVISTCGLGLLLLLSLRRRSRLDPTAAGAEPLPCEETTGREQQLREQIDALLRTHPDTAANVIRDWIQKAA